MKVGDLVKVMIESGVNDYGLITSVNKVEKEVAGGHHVFWYEVACQKSKTFCIATEDMLEVISECR